MESGKWITVVETPSFVARAKVVMSRAEVAEAISMLAQNPEAGDVLEGTGGIRKVRFAVGGRGKSSGVRIVYYFYNESAPLFLLTVFAKNEKANITRAERNELAKLVRELVRTYRAH